MDKVPNEILDDIFKHLPKYELQITERIPVLTPASCKGILSARSTCRRFKQSPVLRDIFARVLEETVIRHSWYHMPILEKISQSEYAEHMTTLSFCTLEFDPWGRADSVRGLGRYLVPILKRFIKLKHLRVYPVTPTFFRERWGQGEYQYSSGPSIGLLSYQDLRHSTIRHVGEQFFLQMMEGLAECETIESLTMPLFKNRIGSVALSLLPPNSLLQCLSRLSINMSGIHALETRGIVRPCILNAVNLEFLEIAVCDFRKPRAMTNISSLGTSQDDWNKKGRAQPLRKLREFRLIADNSFVFAQPEVSDSLRMFPSIRKLGLAHMSLIHGTWETLVAGLRTYDLDTLMLINPGVLNVNVPRGYAYHKFEPTDKVRLAAREVYLVHHAHTWDDNVAQYLPEADYTGFSIFESDAERHQSLRVDQGEVSWRAGEHVP